MLQTVRSVHLDRKQIHLRQEVLKKSNLLSIGHRKWLPLPLQRCQGALWFNLGYVHLQHYC
jgi:hypothetical protein